MNGLFIPEIVKVGFQERSDTYSGKLAYIIYKDEKNTWRKEKSWSGWIDKKIDPIEFKNEPYEGFVLNKKVGDYQSGWDHRKSYCRVYDPRYKFEFEISIDNLLYILENCNSIKGKGLEGEFVYSWSGKDLVLLPTSAIDYKNIKDRTEKIFNKEFIKAKDLLIGNTYINKKGEKYTYLGKYDKYGYNNKISNGKHHWFYTYCEKYNYISLVQYKSISNKFVDCISSEKDSRFDYSFDKMEHSYAYSPLLEENSKYEPYTLEEFIELSRTWTNMYSDKKEFYISKYEGELSAKFTNVYEERYENGWYGSKRLVRDNKRVFYNSIEEAYEQLKPCYKDEYLLNGKLYNGGKKNA